MCVCVCVRSIIASMFPSFSVHYLISVSLLRSLFSFLLALGMPIVFFFTSCLRGILLRSRGGGEGVVASFRFSPDLARFDRPRTLESPTSQCARYFEPFFFPSLSLSRSLALPSRAPEKVVLVGPTRKLPNGCLVVEKEGRAERENRLYPRWSPKEKAGFSKRQDGGAYRVLLENKWPLRCPLLVCDSASLLFPPEMKGNESIN